MMSLPRQVCLIYTFNLVIVLYHFVFLTLIWLISFAKQHPAYCLKNRLHPSFTSPPVVTQLQPHVVRVSWADIIDHKRCVDSFFVTYWSHDEPDTYKVTKSTNADFEDIWLSGNSSFKFEVTAKSIIDYRSPFVNFTLGNTDSISVTTGNY